MPTGLNPIPDHARARMIREALVGNRNELYLTNARFHAWVDTMAHVVLDAADGAAIAWEADTRDVVDERQLLLHLIGQERQIGSVPPDPTGPMPAHPERPRSWAAWT